jgi:hypothetical protein
LLFDKIPKCPTRDPPPVWFTGVLLAGMVLITQREERPSEEKILKCTNSNRDSTRAFYTCHCRRKLFKDFFANNFTLKVHKIENFFDSDFGICVISLLVLHK